MNYESGTFYAPLSQFDDEPIDQFRAFYGQTLMDPVSYVLVYYQLNP